MIDHSQITGIILAGGQGRRMGNVDKGLQPFKGLPMAAHVMMRLGPQVGDLMINANQNLAAYESFGVPVILDVHAGFAGPLAGIHSGLTYAHTDFIVSAPCDVPLIPLDLVKRLSAAMAEQRSDIAVAKTGDQAHPVFCLLPTLLGEHLDNFLKAGGRKIDAWYATLNVAEVPFDDCPDRFINVNTLEELKRLETRTDLA